MPAPKRLRPFLYSLSLVLVLTGISFAYLISATQSDPGPGAFRFDYGRQTFTGIIERTPMPILHVTVGNERIKSGHTLMMSGPGKNGVMNRQAARHGAVVEVTGVILERGSMDMLQVAGGRNGMKPIDEAATIPHTVSLGRWKLAGEICDGKCLAGAMRPGRGLAHKACANLCIAGGVPPVFVSTQPVDGSEFLMIAGSEGSDVSQAIYRHMAQFIAVEGEVTRHGQLLVFSMDPATIEVLP